MIDRNTPPDGNPLLGFVRQKEPLMTEEDQLIRSEKKAKNSGESYTGESTMPISYDDVYDDVLPKDIPDKTLSYKQSLLGDGQMHDKEQAQQGMGDGEDEEDDMNDEYDGLQVVEQQVAGYDCPLFQLSKKEEARIQKPWRQGLIVKLFGRRIGYKALENRLKQMWVRKGVITIIDLGKDYFLIYFSNEEDYIRALEDGPWLIYDHYLIVREWSPNFYPNEATIDKASVWVRIPDLPIEYYDAKVLHFIGNRIGRTVKVDKNTLFQERGKYARICVEMDLTTTLLAMFELNGRIYKVEYEGLHMLCRTCGRFGHYIEGCPEKEKVQTEMNQNIQGQKPGGSDKGSESVKNNQDNIQGQWVVVQKPRRARKNNATPSGGAGGNAGSSKTASAKEPGTRFEILNSINEDETNQDDIRQVITVTAENPPQHVKYNKGQKGKNQSPPITAAKDINNENVNKRAGPRNNEEPIIIIRETNEVNSTANQEIPNATTRMSKGTDMHTSQGNDVDMMVLEKVNNSTTDFGQHQRTRPPDNAYVGSTSISPIIQQPHNGSSQRPTDSSMISSTQEIVAETQALRQSVGGTGDMIVD
ncbi:zinc ion binding / nucleic acid binding protein [Trifolium repens]|nr:zinc ion binding / nucleic acid binding protein [Trifolium repens]